MDDRIVTPLTPIGTISSPYRERFGIPRQAGLAPSVPGTLKIPHTPQNLATIQGLEEFSHFWILFLFHGNPPSQGRPTVRPPRLGGKKRWGVFATRSPHRPNPIGLSLVKQVRTVLNEDEIQIFFLGGDLLHGTPVLDIKPYLPYADSAPDAQGAWANSPPRSLPVVFSPEARRQCEFFENKGYEKLRSILEESLRWDPRPEAQKKNKKTFATLFWDLDVAWSVESSSDESSSERLEIQKIVLREN